MALWRSRVRTPSGPPYYRQSEWYRGTPFVSERKGFFCWPMNEIYIQTEFGRIYARTAGEKSDPLILGLHGWSQRNGWHTWQPLMEPLAAAGYHIVSLDMPGWGQTPPLHLDRPLGHDEAKQVILASLASLDPHRPAILMGKSWGGGLAIEVALEHPARIGALLLTAPAFMDFDRLVALRPPVLLAWAEDDPVIPFHYMAKYQGIPTLIQVTYPTGGHSAAPKNADAFAPVAIEFLRQHSISPAGQHFMENHE